MRKLFVFWIIVGFFLIVFSKQVTLLADIYLLGDPQIYEVKEGDWLSKLAQEHYNDVNLWEELALINMAPDPDYILPGEKILIPDAEAMNKLRDAETISGVAGLVEDQRLALNESQSSKSRSSELAEKELSPSAPPSSESEQPRTDRRPAQEDEAGFPWVLFIAGVLILSGIVGLLGMIIRRRKNRTEISTTGTEHSTSEPGGGNGRHDERSRKKRVRKSKRDEKEEVPFA